MRKAEARKHFKQLRVELSEMERSRADDLMLIQFQSLDLPFLYYLLSYWPIEENNEPNTHLFTEFLKFRNPELKTCYPRASFASTTMEAVATDIDTPFEKTNLNIFEPDKGELIAPLALDMVFVPLLVIDKAGYRVGYGRGFYDRYLAACRTDCIKVGFSYFDPIDQLEDCSEFDVPLNLCITPHNTYVF